MATQIGIGFSQLASPLEAGRRAVRQALEPLSGREPDLVVLFSTPDLKQDQMLKMQAEVRAVTGKAPLLGGCGSGVIVPQGAFTKGVAVLALWSGEMRVVTGVFSGITQNPLEAGQTLVRRLWARREKVDRASNGLLLTLLDAPDQESEAIVRVVEALGDEIGPLYQLVGGRAMDSSAEVKRPVFLDDEGYECAIAAALILTPGAVGVGVRHGYQPLGRPLVVTRAEGNVLYELDGRSAFQAYVEQFPDHPELTLENFGQFAVDYPLGLPQVGREYIVRDPFGVRPDGALQCAGMIPQRAVVRIMGGDRGTLIQAAREAAMDAMRSLGGRRPLLALIFSCVSRLAYLGPAAQEEVAVIREVVGSETPLIGLFSFGEIAAQLDSPSTLHNKTVVVGIIGETGRVTDHHGLRFKAHAW